MTETSQPNNSHNGLKEYFTLWLQRVEVLLDERDRRYEERFKASDDKTSLALASSEKAISKAETATEKRFDNVNEFRETLKDQAANLITRAEVSTKFESYDDKLSSMQKEIQILRETNRLGEGRKEQSQETKKDTQWSVGVIIAVIFSSMGFLLSAIGLIYNITK